MLSKNQSDQIAWAAGLFEGEGCISASPTANHGYTKIQLAMGSTDLDVLERFVGVVGCGVIRPRKKVKETHKDFYIWELNGSNTRLVLDMFMPYFGERRLNKAKFAIELIDLLGIDNSKKTHCPSGHEYTIKNTYWHRGKNRRCRECWAVQRLKRRMAYA